jgi:uncharacterized protein (TIGR01777 family)
MKIGITGATGLLGSALVPQLRSEGHQVIRVVRRNAGPGDVMWDPSAGTIDQEALNGVDAVVHLAGAGIGDHRWSADYRQTILSSRVNGTSTLAGALSLLPNPPSVMVTASAVGYYGLRGDEVLTEASGPGTGFLADVCAQWEDAASAAASAGIRVVALRTGVVLSAAGGALKKQLLPFRLGLGARLGHGDQWLSWITRRDAVAAISFLLNHENLDGPFNLSSPHPVPNAEFTQQLGRALHRPAVLAVPAPLMRLVLGTDMAAELLLASQRVLPDRLLGTGFAFLDAELPGALANALSDRAMVPGTG